MVLDTTYVTATYHAPATGVSTGGFWACAERRHAELNALARELILTNKHDLGIVVEPVAGTAQFPCISIGTMRGHAVAWAGRGVAVIDFTQARVEISTHVLDSERDALDFAFSADVLEIVVLATSSTHRVVTNHATSTTRVIRCAPAIVFDRLAWMAQHFPGALNIDALAADAAYCAISWVSRLRRERHAFFSSTRVDHVTPPLRVCGLSREFLLAGLVNDGGDDEQDDDDVRVLWGDLLARGRVDAALPPRATTTTNDTTTDTRGRRHQVARACARLLSAEVGRPNERLIEDLVTALQRASLPGEDVRCAHLVLRGTHVGRRAKRTTTATNDDDNAARTAFVRERDGRADLRTRWFEARALARAHETTWRTTAWARLTSSSTTSSVVPRLSPDRFRIRGIRGLDLELVQTCGLVEVSGPRARELVTWMLVGVLAAQLRLPIPTSLVGSDDGGRARTVEAPAFSSLALAQWTRARGLVGDDARTLGDHAHAMVLVVDVTTPDALNAVRAASEAHPQRLYVVEHRVFAVTTTTTTGEHTRVAVASNGTCTFGETWNGLSDDEREARDALAFITPPSTEPRTSHAS